MLTFKISLCGHISISGSKCNYFVNDQIAYRSDCTFIIAKRQSKIKQWKVSPFENCSEEEKAVNLIKNKKHLTAEGKLEMINGALR